MKKYKFETRIEAGDGGGAFVLFPYDTRKEFATKHQLDYECSRLTVLGFCSGDDVIGTNPLA